VSKALDSILSTAKKNLLRGKQDIKPCDNLYKFYFDTNLYGNKQVSSLCRHRKKGKEKTPVIIHLVFTPFGFNKDRKLYC
jgi:hypothetical protein